MAMLGDIPLEIVELILSYAEPIAVACFSRTCRLYYTLIYESEDQHLWRSLFLSEEELFDDPRKCQNSLGEPLVLDESEYDWRGELQRRIRAQTVVYNPACCRDDELAEVLATLVSVINHTLPTSANHASLEVSKNLLWIAQCPLAEFIEYLHAQRTALSPEQRQLLGQLHTLFGLPVYDLKPERRVESRAYVYDMRNYTEENCWGPFTHDGRRAVNWEHLQAVQHVMAMHIAERQMESVVLNSMILFVYCQAQLADVSEAEDDWIDWAGVEGVWDCSFCFVDHRDLTTYNDPEFLYEEPRDISLFESPAFLEVFRSFNVYMRVTGNVPNPKHPTRPAIVFEGVVHDMHTMIGEVSVAPDNTVRWSFTSGENNQMIWSSEGVQIGPAQSTFGVLGTWTTVFHDEQDPIGPFWLRKDQDKTHITGVLDDNA
ncbi:hypothetical protein DFH11DRAFT_304122 [Phellopilus nigrolimitatus]|nr:hypothetical protein DFH11DRAFT_304122 [Phellopilus nigrolimitatus]